MDIPDLDEINHELNFQRLRKRIGAEMVIDANDKIIELIVLQRKLGQLGTADLRVVRDDDR